MGATRLAIKKKRKDAEGHCDEVDLGNGFGIGKQLSTISALLCKAADSGLNINHRRQS
jgi:hypothetical protein